MRGDVTSNDSPGTHNCPSPNVRPPENDCAATNPDVICDFNGDLLNSLCANRTVEAVEAMITRHNHRQPRYGDTRANAQITMPIQDRIWTNSRTARH
jgi:hypothetical protein